MGEMANATRATSAHAGNEEQFYAISAYKLQIYNPKSKNFFACGAIFLPTDYQISVEISGNEKSHSYQISQRISGIFKKG